MSGLWRVKSSNHVSGPFPFAELVQYARDGRLAADDVVCEGSGPWRFANSIPGLFPQRAGKPGEMGGGSASTEPQIQRSSATVDLKSDAAPPQACDAWYYRLGDAEHGPLAFDELRDLLSHSVDLAQEALIRRADQFDWTPFSAPPTAGMAPAAAVSTSPAGDAQPSANAATPTRSTQPRFNWAEWLQQNRLQIAGTALWIVGNATIWFWNSDPYTLERRYLADLDRIVENAHAMQSRQADGAEWKSFRQTSQASLANVVRDLKATATPSKPARQQLLWAARDEIPRILSSEGRSTDAEKKVAERLQIVRRLISQP